MRMTSVGDSEAPTRDDRRHWPSSVCLSFLDPWSSVVQLHQTVRDCFVCQPQQMVQTQTSRLSTGFQLTSDMLRCNLSVAPDHFLRNWHPRPFTGTPLIKVCYAKVRPRHFLRQKTQHHLSKSLHSRRECRTHCHCRLEDSVSVQPLRLGISPDIRCACLDRHPLTLFVTQGNAVPFLGNNIAQVILCPRSRDSLSPKNP